jgi:hypothetical protein
MTGRRLLAASAVAVAAIATGCAPARISLPSGAGTPFPEFAAAYQTATGDCARVTTITASIALSGRAGKTKLRGRIDAGLAADGQIRLEGFPPVMFGAGPYFILAARGAESTLLLPRAGRVLRNARPAATVQALAGVALEPDELRAVLSGCGLGIVQPSGGRTFPNGWAAIDAGPVTVFIQQIEGTWRIVAGTRPPLTLEYAAFQSGRPTNVRLISTPGQSDAVTDLRLNLSQVEINTTLERKVFEVEVPREAVPITLEELRKMGPLGGGA